MKDNPSFEKEIVLEKNCVQKNNTGGLGRGKSHSFFARSLFAIYRLSGSLELARNNQKAWHRTIDGFYVIFIGLGLIMGCLNSYLILSWTEPIQ